MLAAKLRDVGASFHQRAAQSLDMSSLPSLTSGSGYSRESGAGSPPGSAGFTFGNGWGGASTTLYNSSSRAASASTESINKEMDDVARVISSLELA